MKKMGFAALLCVLGGCTTTGSGNMHTMRTANPGVFDRPYGTSAPAVKTNVVYTDQYEKPLTARDIKAINETIAAQRGRDWAPHEEVMQELMTDEI